MWNKTVWNKAVMLASVMVMVLLSGCSSMTHSESIMVSRADKQAGGVKAIRHLQRGDDQQCEIEINQKTPDPRDLNAEIWRVLICHRLYQYKVTFEPQADDRFKITAIQFLDP